MADGFAVLTFLGISLLFVLLTLLFCALVLLHDLRKKYSHIPGPEIHSFVWGNGKEFQRQENQGKAKILIFEDLIQKYGPVLVTWDIYKPIVTVLDQNITEGILEPSEFKDCISNGDFSTLFEQRFLGRGTQFVYGSDCVFNNTYVRRHLKNFNACCDMFMIKLQTMADGKAEVKMTEQFERFSIDVIAKVAFGLNLNCMQDPDMPFYKALNECQDAISWSMCHPFHQWDVTSYEYQNSVTEALKYLRDFGKKLVDRRRTDVDNEEAVDDDYLTCILTVADSDATVTLDDILDEFVSVFISGQSQLTSLLSNMLLELMQQPLIEEKIYEEVINTVTSDSPVTFEVFNGLKFTSCVIKETVRLHPPVTAVLAHMSRSGKLGTYSIPDNTTVQIIPYLMQTNPEIWKQPKEFIPERFAESGDTSVATHFPYAMRNHNFINGLFAECLVKVVFPSLLHKFKFDFKADQDVRPSGELFSVPIDGVVCTLSQV